MLRGLRPVLSRVRLARFPPRPLPARALSHCRTLCTAPSGTSEQPKAGAPKEPEPEGAKEDSSEAAQRMRLLEAAMQFVPEKGWTVDALSAGAIRCGLSPAAHGILARGPVELVEHFVSGCDAALAKELEERHEELIELETQNRLLLAMQTRLQMLEPHVGTWSQALALRTLPTNLPGTLLSAHALASVFLDACGADAQARSAAVATSCTSRASLRWPAPPHRPHLTPCARSASLLWRQPWWTHTSSASPSGPSTAQPSSTCSRTGPCLYIYAMLCAYVLTGG